MLFPSILFSQLEKHPVFDNCKDSETTSLKDCFYSETKNLFFNKFKVPNIVKKENYKQAVTATFIVTKKGEFKLIYVSSPYIEIKEEVTRVFKSFPKIKPATFNGINIEMRFEIPIHFPNPTKVEKPEKLKIDISTVVAQTKLADSTFLEDNSYLNIPFTHQRYIDFEYAFHKNKGTHTASKPYTYKEVNKYYNLTEEKKKFLKPNKFSWIGKKLWNEHLLQIKRKNYWLTLDFLVDVQFGKDNSAIPYTYNNSRVFQVNGALGKKLSFSSTIYESQGRFAEYINAYINNRATNVRPRFSEGLVPGRGKAKRFKTDAFDYPVAEGYLVYRANKNMQFQFGQGKNFLGDGYRSFLLSDVSSPTTYLKAQFNFWKIQYTNIWMWITEPAISNPSNPNEGARKYIAAHYLSINISEKLNIGLFETAISTGENGFDAGFMNPFIFYRSLEFNRGEDAGNALVGLTSKYKLNNKVALYSQLVIDEFSVGNLNNLSDWRNKFAYQLGAKYFDAFDIKNLYLQAEYNYARPYTFSHRSPILNYGNYSQPLGHLWGANFWEAIAIARYKKDRWSGSAKMIFGEKGYDFQDQVVSFGGDIYQSYDIRIGNTGNTLTQGNTAKIFLLDFQGNYLLNPANNLSLFAGISYRKFSTNVALTAFPSGETFWFSAGIKADLFNWYFDF